ncbi:Stage II sporulation protein E (SpoIIE) [Sinosporangium album]|uniref:Stage II sporulation protein E (SpoIIE) n=1 Tax=Sinosporangium album TaxID=504805 RepID=A0A1G7T448_9ACTN|nr:PP2C family protein-serine/threonine phosphatase [Sinosporangium album]SDG30137.1 Stage II sporulation protein E (SpoIIE) [Sinosporangium album]
MGSPSGVERMLTGLLAASHVASMEQVPDLVEEHAAHAGLAPVLIYLADLQENVLRLLAGRAGAGGEGAPGELAVDTTLAGRAFQEVRVLAGKDAGGRVDHWWVPVVNGNERLGVLRVRGGAGERAAEHGELLACLVAMIVVCARSYSDSYARLVRSQPMNVAAEMQWDMLPPLTIACPRVVIGAVLEPAYEIGGDAFDYAIDGDAVHVAIFDAMGHDVSSGLTSNLAMAASRNHRRRGLDLVANSIAVERVLLREFGEGTRFVTAIMAHLDLTTGVFTWVNRGHHPPVVIRGGRWVATLECPPGHPMGLDLDLPVELCREQLEPGDRVLLYTDGITEARDAWGKEFGLQRFVDFVIKRDVDVLPTPERLRRLIRSVLDYHDGRLSDDATVLLVEWRGGHSPQVEDARP